MKKFEEEMKEWFGSPTGFNMEFQSGYEAYSALIKRFKGYISPDDHQAEIGKIELQNLKYREEIARMQKSLRKKNKAIKELNAAVKKSKARLKECEDLRIEANNSAAMEYSRKCEVVEERAELKRENQRLRAENLAVKTLVEDAKKQQPEIPEVSKEVANIYEKHKDQHHKLSVILEELYVNTFATFGSSLTQGEVDDIVVAMRTNGYTVAKEKRFYLKHKSVLIFDPDSDDSDVDELYLGAGGNFVPYQHLAKIFTQQEIDSMAADSYEQIEVEE